MAPVTSFRSGKLMDLSLSLRAIWNPPLTVLRTGMLMLFSLVLSSKTRSPVVVRLAALKLVKVLPQKPS